MAKYTGEECAEHIRAQLGEWPTAKTPAARLFTQWPAAPETLRPGDWLILDAPELALKYRERALSAGALVLEVAEVEPDAVKENAASMRALLCQVMTLSMAQSSSVEPVKRYMFSGMCSWQWKAALAAFLDCGFVAQDALTLAYAWRETEQGSASSFLNSWPEQLQTFPHLLEQPPVSAPFAPCPTRLGLYAVVPTVAWVERLLACGVRTLQLRIKKKVQGHIQGQTSPAALEPHEVQEIKHVIRAAKACDARLFINDYWEHAIELGAYGVHLGQEDLETADLNRIAKAGLRLGISTHGYYEMVRAYQIKPSYIALGAVFPTTTKQMPTAPQGIIRLARYARLFKGSMPVVAIGGIDGSVIQDVLATGVESVAVVRAITEASNPEQAVAQLQKFF